MDEKIYGRQFREGQPRPILEMGRQEASAEAVRRARCYAREQGRREVTAADLRAMYDDDHLLRAHALGFAGPGRQRAQRERASQHFAEEVHKYTALGYSREGAIERTREEERRGGLTRVRAGLPKNSPWAVQGERRRQDEAHRFAQLVGGGPFVTSEHRYAAGPGPLSLSHEEKLRTFRPVLVRQVAADCLLRNIRQPDGYSRDWVDAWWGVNVPPPPPRSGSDKGLLDGYNKARVRFVEEVLEAARTLLRDPAERAKLAPTRLGG